MQQIPERATAPPSLGAREIRRQRREEETIEEPLDEVPVGADVAEAERLGKRTRQHARERRRAEPVVVPDHVGGGVARRVQHGMRHSNAPPVRQLLVDRRQLPLEVGQPLAELRHRTARPDRQRCFVFREPAGVLDPCRRRPPGRRPIRTRPRRAASLARAHTRARPAPARSAVPRGNAPSASRPRARRTTPRDASARAGPTSRRAKGRRPRRARPRGSPGTCRSSACHAPIRRGPDRAPRGRRRGARANRADGRARCAVCSRPPPRRAPPPGARRATPAPPPAARTPHARLAHGARSLPAAGAPARRAAR